MGMGNARETAISAKAKYLREILRRSWMVLTRRHKEFQHDGTCRQIFGVVPEEWKGCACHAQVLMRWLAMKAVMRRYREWL